MIAHVWTDDELLHILAMRDGGWSARESAAWLKKLRGLAVTKNAIVGALHRIDTQYRASA